MARKGVTAQIHPGLARHLARTGKAKRVTGQSRTRKAGKVTVQGGVKVIGSATVTREPEKRVERAPTMRKVVRRDLEALSRQIEQICNGLTQAAHEEREERDGEQEHEQA